MTLPPGRGPIPVDGINPATDPELAKAAGELNAWLDYLFHPESHDGPRIYRGRGLDSSGHDITNIDSEMPRRMENLDQDRQYVTVSIIDAYQTDPGVFFRPAQAISGINESLVDSTYTKLTQGCFTYNDPNKAGGEGRLTSVKYPELHPVRLNWMEMRKGWLGSQALAAHEYENDFIAFQVYTENCFYVVAEHLVRYRAIFQKAGEDIAKLMYAMTDTFAKHDYYRGGDGFKFDVWSIFVTTVVAAATTVIGGPVTTAVVLKTAATELLGEALKTAESTSRKSQLLIEDQTYLRDSVKQYIDQVTNIERDVSHAVKDLYESLRIQVDKLRADRQYEAKPDSHTKTMWVPHYRDYL
jgi:hypothetical protein